MTDVYTELPDEICDEDHVYLRCVQLHMAADFFMIPELKPACLGRIKELLHSEMIHVQMKFCCSETKSTSFLEPGSLSPMFDAVRLAYDYDLVDIKKAFLDFVEATHFWIVRDETFRAGRNEIPRFGLDVFDALTNAIAKRRAYCPLYFPDGCKVCGKNIFEIPGAYLATLESPPSEDSLYGVCNLCSVKKKGKRTASMTDA